MRILIFSEVISPYVSGISSYIDVLKKGLEKMSHQVVVVTSSPDVKDAVFKNDIVTCPARKTKNKYGHECKRAYDTKVIEFICSFNPDIIHIHTDTKIGYMGLEVADKTEKPVVFTIHDYYMDRFASDKLRFTWNIKTYFERKHFIDMLDNSDIITSSCSRADIFVNNAGRDVDVQVIQPSIDTELFDYRKSTKDSAKKVRERFGLSPTASVAVFAGSLTVEKNLEFTLTAFAKYLSKSDNIQFLIVGDGSEKDYLQELCIKLKISDRVFFAGTVPNEEMPEIYSACDIYVCSYDDGLMSMSFVEAIACGLPVLIKEDKERLVHSMIKNGVNGFVYTKKSEFAKYLKILVTLSESKKRRIKELVRSTLSSVDDLHMAQQYVKIYESLPKHSKK